MRGAIAACRMQMGWLAGFDLEMVASRTVLVHESVLRFRPIGRNEWKIELKRKEVLSESLPHEDKRRVQE